MSTSSSIWSWSDFCRGMDDLRLPKLVERFTLGQEVAVDFIAVGEVESHRRMHLQGWSDTMSSADMPETSAKPIGAASRGTIEADTVALGIVPPACC